MDTINCQSILFSDQDTRMIRFWQNSYTTTQDNINRNQIYP